MKLSPNKILSRRYEGNQDKFKLGTGTNNCDLLVLVPAFAIDRIPRPVWVKFGLNSSSNGFPHIDCPPVPVPVGSPP